MAETGGLPAGVARALAAGRLGHALLFSGPPGAGKGAAALALARALLCEGGPPGCGVCRSCRQAEAGAHPDLVAVAPAGDSIRLEQVRAVVRAVHRRPLQAGTLVTVIREADRMTEEAANALLKVLEDPPGPAVFVLVTAAPAALLPTIRSRCQEFPFRSPPPEAVAAELERLGWDARAALRVARLAEGNLELARRLAGGPELSRAAALAARVLAAACPPEEPDAGALLALAAELEAAEEGVRAGAAPVSPLDVLAWAVRDALVERLEAEGGPPAPPLLAALRRLQQWRRDLRGGVNARLALEVLLLDLRDILAGRYNLDELTPFLAVTPG